MTIMNVLPLSADDISIKITKKYLNLPVSSKAGRAEMTFIIDGDTERRFDIRLASSEPDYWVFCDMTGLPHEIYLAIILLFPR